MSDPSVAVHAGDALVGGPRWHRPRSPNCGSRRVREWGMIYVGYDVVAVSQDGDVQGDGLGDEPCYESYGYEHLMCRDCDHQDEDPTAWIPQPDINLGEN
jgi:hypothetical protein